MQTSQAGFALIKEFEGKSLTVYFDPAGKQTIGYGHLLRGNESFTTITDEQANELLAIDVRQTEEVVLSLVKVSLNQNQFDALIDFTFNMGVLRLTTSGLLTALNLGNYRAAAEQFQNWVYLTSPVTGRKEVSPGLARRRAAEEALFLKPIGTG